MHITCGVADNKIVNGEPSATLRPLREETDHSMPHPDNNQSPRHFHQFIATALKLRLINSLMNQVFKGITRSNGMLESSDDILFVVIFPYHIPLFLGFRLQR